MTTQEKRKLFEEVMKSVAPLVKNKILEFCSSNILSTDIRKHFGYYDEVVSWVDRICSSLNNINESLPNDFNSVDSKILLNSIKRWFNEKQSSIRHEIYNGVVERVDCLLIANSVEVSSIVLNRKNNECLKLLDEYMKKCSYKRIFTKEIEGKIVVVYENAEPSEVDFSKYEQYGKIQNIYHITPLENAYDILKNGFCLSERDFKSGITYDKRAYFFINEHFADQYRYDIHNEYKTGRFVKIIVPFDVLRQRGIRFYYDPLLPSSSAIYTTQKIEPFDGMSYDIYPSIGEEMKKKKEYELQSIALQREEMEEVFKNLRKERNEEDKK